MASGIASGITSGIVTGMTETKVRENKARRAAGRQGLILQKSRRRDPNAIDFNGYMLVDGRTNAAVVGSHPWAYSADLDEVEDFLEQSTRPTDVYVISGDERYTPETWPSIEKTSHLEWDEVRRLWRLSYWSERQQGVDDYVFGDQNWTIREVVEEAKSFLLGPRRN